VEVAENRTALYQKTKLRYFYKRQETQLVNLYSSSHFKRHAQILAFVDHSLLMNDKCPLKSPLQGPTTFHPETLATPIHRNLKFPEV
jgi:hypothetical protein